jgi:hypothetical protein
LVHQLGVVDLRRPGHLPRGHHLVIVVVVYMCADCQLRYRISSLSDSNGGATSATTGDGQQRSSSLCRSPSRLWLMAPLLWPMGLSYRRF